ncbi:hypothetical protein [Streptomyces sp. NPDC002676]
MEQSLANGSRNQSRCDHHSVLEPRHHALPVCFPVHDDDGQTGLVVGCDHPTVTFAVDNNRPRAPFRYAHAAQTFTARTLRPAVFLIVSLSEAASPSGLSVFTKRRRTGRRGLVVKSDREIMEIFEAYDLTETVWLAATLTVRVLSPPRRASRSIFLGAARAVTDWTIRTFIEQRIGWPTDQPGLSRPVRLRA